MYKYIIASIFSIISVLFLVIGCNNDSNTQEESSLSNAILGIQSNEINEKITGAQVIITKPYLGDISEKQRKQLINQLKRNLKTSNNKLLLCSLEALYRLNYSPSDKYLQQVIKIFKNRRNKQQLRGRAIIIIAKMEKSGSQCFSLIKETYEKDKTHSGLISYCENALVRISPHNKKAFTFLKKLINDKEYIGRHSLISKLGELGADGKKAIPLLTKIALDENDRWREWALVSLFRIDPNSEKPIDLLMKDLKSKPALLDKLQIIRMFVRIKMLSDQGSKVQKATPMLLEMLNNPPYRSKDKNYILKKEIFGTLAIISPYNQEVIDSLIKHLLYTELHAKAFSALEVIYLENPEKKIAINLTKYFEKHEVYPKKSIAKQLNKEYYKKYDLKPSMYVLNSLNR